jgi:hypothetical protein
MTMSPFQSFIDSIPNTNNRNKFEQFLNWIHQEYPHLDRPNQMEPTDVYPKWYVHYRF